MTTPRLATPDATMAICSGVTCTSYWPIELWASCGLFSSAGTLLGVTRIGTSRASPKPNFAACDCSASAPICSPR